MVELQAMLPLARPARLRGVINPNPNPNPNLNPTPTPTPDPDPSQDLLAFEEQLSQADPAELPSRRRKPAASKPEAARRADDSSAHGSPAEEAEARGWLGLGLGLRSRLGLG